MSLAIIDRPIAFQRSFVRLGTGINGALLLSQLVYWHNRSTGWFYKTQIEINEETGLTRTEQETARKKLVKLGIIEEKLYGVPAKLHFKINEQLLMNLLSNLECSTPTNKVEEKQHTSLQGSCKQESRDPAYSDAGILQTNTETTQEITTETTTDIKKINKKNLDLSGFIQQPSGQVWFDYLEHRKNKKARLTQTALNLLINQINQCVAFGYSTDEVLAECMVRGWIGFKSEWVLKREQQKTSTGFMTLEERNRIAFEKSLRELS